jgi:lipoprotein-anchoring transpeptidase ErfK/SrfK
VNGHGPSPSASNASERGRDGRSRWLAVVAIGCVLGLAATACSGGGGSSSGSHSSPAAKKTASTSGSTLSITPASGSANVNPAQGITVTATQGKISGVTVTMGGEQVSGTLNAAKTVWHSTWALAVSQSYTVTARATSSSGQTVTRTSAFHTLTPSQTFTTQILEGQGATYGVGMPIILYFSHEITNKAAVERSLEVMTSKPVVGVWHWDDPCNMAPVCLYFRPRSYWPANTQVSFIGHLNGVEGAPGVYGDHTLTQSFTIGDSLIVVASTATHHMSLYRNGRLFAHWPISSGRPGDDTPNGTYLTIDKGNPVIMKGPGYSLPVPWSVRFTWSGDYLHDAYWSVGEQGFTNVSHGCVNMPPADAQTYYNMELPGDPVTITGSPRAGVWDNGWTMWFLNWNRYLRGSALGQAVEAGPGGSTFVSPSALPASTATAPLGSPDPGNWSAS